MGGSAETDELASFARLETIMRRIAVKKSEIAKTLRTSIENLDAGHELSAEQLARVAGGMKIGGGGGGIFGGGGGVVGENKCWQASSSVVNPGDPDNAQDYVVD